MFLFGSSLFIWDLKGQNFDVIYPNLCVVYTSSKYLVNFKPYNSYSDSWTHLKLRGKCAYPRWVIAQGWNSVYRLAQYVAINIMLTLAYLWYILCLGLAWVSTFAILCNAKLDVGVRNNADSSHMAKLRMHRQFKAQVTAAMDGKMCSTTMFACIVQLFIFYYTKLLLIYIFGCSMRVRCWSFFSRRISMI